MREDKYTPIRTIEASFEGWHVVVSEHAYNELQKYVENVETFLRNSVEEFSIRAARKARYQEDIPGYKVEDSYKDPSFIRYIVRREFGDDVDSVISFEAVLMGLINNGEITFTK